MFIMDWIKSHPMAVVLVISVLISLSSIGSAFYMYGQWQDARNHAAALETIKQTQAGQLQEFNAKLGLAQSQLTTASDLQTKYKSELERVNADFAGQLTKYKAVLASRDHTIALLKGRVDGGTTVVSLRDEHDTNTPNVVPEAQVPHLQYVWQDPTHRFKLTDPDISVSNNEHFEYHQNVAITGYVFKDKKGNLQLRKTEMQEMLEKPDGTYEAIPDSNITLVSSQFEYQNDTSRSWWDILYPRVYGSFDTSLHPGLGVQILDLGRYYDWANVGLHVGTAFDVTSFPYNLKHSTLGIGLHYTFIRPLIDTNVAIGATVSTPYDHFMQQPVFSIDAMVFFNN